MEVVRNIIIEKRFETLLVPLTNEERSLLEESLIGNGCIDPLLLWKHKGKEILIDGHNRFRICRKHNIPFNVDYLDFESFDEAQEWIINNQLGRRNLTLDQLSYYRGLKYLKLKKNKGGYERVLSKGHNELLTAKVVGDEFQVSESTVKRDANYALGIDAIGKSNPDLKLKLLTGKCEFKKKDIQLLGESKLSITVKNEADLYNKIEQLKNESLNKVEKELDSITIGEESKEEIVENPFLSNNDRIKRIKGQILSTINKAIENKDLIAIEKLKELIERLELLISK